MGAGGGRSSSSPGINITPTILPKKIEEQLILCAFIALPNAARSPEVALELR